MKDDQKQIDFTLDEARALFEIAPESFKEKLLTHFDRKELSYRPQDDYTDLPGFIAYYSKQKNSTYNSIAAQAEAGIKDSGMAHDVLHLMHDHLSPQGGQFYVVYNPTTQLLQVEQITTILIHPFGIESIELALLLMEGFSSVWKLWYGVLWIKNK